MEVSGGNSGDASSAHSEPTLAFGDVLGIAAKLIPIFLPFRFDVALTTFVSSGATSVVTENNAFIDPV